MTLSKPVLFLLAFAICLNTLSRYSDFKLGLHAIIEDISAFELSWRRK